MSPRILAAPLAALVLACGAGANGPAAPAADGVRSLVAALRSDDPHAAYELLSGDTRKKVSYDQFALEWKTSAAERAWQAKALEEGLRGDPDVGERATLTYRDTKVVALEREGKVWRLETPLVGPVHAARPRDAIRQFADALHAKDLEAALRLLTTRRRDGIAQQITGFVAGLQKRMDGKIEEIGTDRAELRWDDNGIRYRIVLRKEDDEWRIDDIHIRAAPEDEGSDEGSNQGNEGGGDFD